MSDWLYLSGFVALVALGLWLLWLATRPNGVPKPKALTALESAASKIAAKVTGRATAAAPHAPQRRSPDDLPDAAERGRLKARLVRRGFHGRDLAMLDRDDLTRREHGERLADLLRKPARGSE